MTLFEIFFVMFYASCGTLLAIVLGKMWGWGGAVIGFIVGVGGAVVFCRGLASGFHAIFPLRPKCRHGKCSPKDYEWQLRGKNVVYKCRCGDQYVHEGRRFMELQPDGGKRPYKKRGFMGRWENDEA